MTTAGLQAKVSLRRAWFEAHPNQPVPESRAAVEKLFAAIEDEGTLLASRPIKYHAHGRLIDRSPGGRIYEVDLIIEPQEAAE